MKFQISFLALAALAFAHPPSYYPGNPHCLSQAQAETLVARYAAVVAQQPSDIGNATETAIAITAATYSETSDSANIQIGVPLGAVTVPSKQAFVIGSQQNPPVVFQTIEVFVACKPGTTNGPTAITWQWVSTAFGSGQYEVKGFHLFKVGPGGKIRQTFFEFNSIAGALDTGYSVLTPNGTELVVLTS